MSYRITELDPYLRPYEEHIENLMKAYHAKKRELVGNGRLADFANAHLYFGIHQTEEGWVYREWAPGAEAMFFTGDFNGWDVHATPMTALENGVFEVRLQGKDALRPGQKVQAIVHHGGELLRRVPLYATRVVQDPVTYLWCAEVTEHKPFAWTDESFRPEKVPFIYECHIGMASEEGKVASYREFRENVLPRVAKLGYNTLQIMAIMEHPYYGSFGYQVSSFFAASSRYGTGEELKELVNAAHEMGIAVLLDVVHSHAVKNTLDGINQFDGTDYQFFHEGPRGDHPAWGTKLFNYGKNEVLHFLLSNLKYWMEEYHFDGFRFDGVTSMLYLDHGLGSAFTNYGMYYTLNTDGDAVTYLRLANDLIHSVNKHAITIAEDMSGMPGMCLPTKEGGLGFDFRLGMGVPDLWIKYLKEYRDEDWNVGHLWYELTNRRKGEKTVGYCESHDQALVGDKTIMFRLCDAEMYTSMNKQSQSPVIDRGMALHKMIRLLTASLAGEGYLTFMGNEFGHPEWIDFPREGNGWSYHYCRRQWSLADNGLLRYGDLQAFDAAMVALLKTGRLMLSPAYSLWEKREDYVLIYGKGNTVFAFNFHPSYSHDPYFIPTPVEGSYVVALSTDDKAFGGPERIDTAYRYKAARQPDGRIGFYCYLPSRSALVLKLKRKK